MITQDILKDFFTYENGFLFWKVKRSRVKIGDKAGIITTHNNETYTKVGLLGKYYRASRLIFLFHKGYLPVEVDHIDRNSLNDKIENLREADRSNNCKNRKSRINSSSQYLGVSWSKDRKKWIACIHYNDISKNLGGYIKESDAALIYNRYAVKYHGEFANLNIIKP